MTFLIFYSWNTTHVIWSVILQDYKSNQRIDHAICSPHRTDGTLRPKFLVRAQAFLRANPKRGAKCESIGETPEFDLKKT
jgi:hypothetical protein